MRMRGGASVAAAVLFGVAMVGTARGAEHPLKLNEAIMFALEKNEDLVIEHESVNAAEADVQAASGVYDPVLGVDGTWSKLKPPINSSFAGAPPGELASETETTDVGIGLRQYLPTGGELALRGGGSRGTTDDTFTLLSPAYDTNAGVAFRQPLLRDLTIDAERLGIKVAKAGRQGAEASLRRTVSETVASVERAYWLLTAVRLGVAVREEAVELANEQLGETETRVQAGVAPQTEIAQPRAELERRRGELLDARELLVRAEDNLKQLILADTDDELWRSQLVPVDSVGVEIHSVNVDSALAQALAIRPELAEDAAVIEQRKAEAAFARSGVWPALDLVAVYDRYGLAGSQNPNGPQDPIPYQVDGDLGDSFDTLADGDFHSARVGLALELPILNREAKGRRAAAESFQKQAEAELTRTRKSIRAEVLDAAARVETASQRIDAARSGREAAEIQLSAERDRFASGLSTNFLVLTRQNDLSAARLDEIRAITDYRTARTEMARASGTLIEERGIQVSTEEND
jgi:outer membrane protein TolC